MFELTVLSDGAYRVIPFSKGLSLRELLEKAGVWIRCGCLGNGACGLCLVKIENGFVNEPTKNESLLLSNEQLTSGIRLACSVMPQNDLSVRVIEKAPSSPWRKMDPGSLLCMPAHYKPAIGATGYGLAVDLGTTNISLSLWDLSGGRRIGAITGANPQFRFGSDVVSRLTAAGESKENAKTLAQLPLSAMRGALREMNLSHSINLREVRRVNIVGNTTMLALLTEMDPDILLQPRSWTQPMDCSCYNCKAWAGILGIDPGATISVSQPLAGFVGSDLLAGALATNLTRQPGSLLLDFGTNIEMALWDGKTLHVTSAPGGPAFEQTAGTYGSDMVNCIANLIGKGVVTSTGKLLSTQKKLKPRDVDMFQRAKAGTGAGTAALLAKANLSARELQRVCICGIFGSHLNIANAQKTGLLPDIPADRIQLCGDTALSGCELLLLSHGANAELAELRKHAAIINLAQMPDFETLFMENLYLKKAGK